MTWQELLAEYKEKVVVTYPSMDFTEVFRKEAPDVLSLIHIYLHHWNMTIPDNGRAG